MNILVCISRVPDTATKISVSGNGTSIDKGGVKFILNPYDEFAIEEALQLKQKSGGEVTAVTVSYEDAKDVMRTALAMGVDKAVILKAKDENFDSNYVAKNLAEFSKEINPDIIFAGRQSVDFDSFQVPSMLAAYLDMPSISVVSKLEIQDGKLTAERDIEGGKEQLEAELPCVISTQKGLNEPRYPKLPDIMKAKKKPIDEKDASDAEYITEVVSMDIPKKDRVGKILGDSDSDIADIVKSLHEDAKVI